MEFHVRTWNAVEFHILHSPRGIFMERVCVENVCGSPLQEMIPNFCPLPLLRVFVYRTCTRALSRVQYGNCRTRGVVETR